MAWRGRIGGKISALTAISDLGEGMFRKRVRWAASEPVVHGGHTGHTGQQRDSAHGMDLCNRQNGGSRMLPTYRYWIRDGAGRTQEEAERNMNVVVDWQVRGGGFAFAGGGLISFTASVDISAVRWQRPALGLELVLGMQSLVIG